MNDSRPRNDHGQFAPEAQGELDANNTSAAYNPQIIENRKATLGEKLRRAIGLRGGVEESVPERVLSAKMQLKELAERVEKKQLDPAMGRLGSLALAGTVGTLAAGVTGAGIHAAIDRGGTPTNVFGKLPGQEMEPFMAFGKTQADADENLRVERKKVEVHNRRVGRSYPDVRRNEVLDRLARKKGYKVLTPEDAGLDSTKFPAVVVPKGAVPGSEKGAFIRKRNAPDFIRAHEIGHVSQDLAKTPVRAAWTKASRGAFGLAPLGILSAVVNKDKENDSKATAIAGAGTLAALPVLHNEIDASARGYKVMRRLGSSRLRAAGAFAGLPTYATMASLPALGWGARKLRQSKSEKSKQLSMKTHKAQLKELASRSQVAYEQEVQPQQSNHTAKLAALGIGLGLGVGGGVAGYKLLKPAVGKIVSSAETIANAAKTGIPQAADAVTGAANNAKSAMSIGSDMGKAWDWLKATRVGNQVKRGAWNLAHPVQYAREVKGGLSMMSPASLKEAVAVGERRQAAFSKWKAGAKNPTAEQAALVRENLKKTIQQPKPPEANRPAWASGDTLFNAKLRLRELAVKEFADPKKEPLSLKQKVGIGAGLGAAAVGATLMPAAASMFRIKSRNLAHSALAWGASKRGLRAIIKPPKGDPNRHGRFVADYVEAAQSVLNKGVQGKIAGKVLQHAKANPKGKVAKAVGGELGDYGVSHYARFRSGPREAMAHWDSEVGDLINHKGKQKGILGADNNIVAGANPNAVRTVNRRRGEMDRGRKAVNDEINEQLWHHGKSESEALRHVAENTKNKDSLAYFRNLAHHNAGAADKYAKISLAAPGLVIAGGATAGLSARRKEKL